MEQDSWTGIDAMKDMHHYGCSKILYRNWSRYLFRDGAMRSILWIFGHNPWEILVGTYLINQHLSSEQKSFGRKVTYVLTNSLVCYWLQV